MTDNTHISGCVPGCTVSTPASDYQDKKYGNKVRVFNCGAKDDKGTCTVCGKEKNLS